MRGTSSCKRKTRTCLPYFEMNLNVFFSTDHAPLCYGSIQELPGCPRTVSGSSCWGYTEVNTIMHYALMIFCVLNSNRKILFVIIIITNSNQTLTL